MAGYKNYSMSNNACNAYSNGEAPLSKWTKKMVISGYNQICEDNELKPLNLLKINVKTLKSELLIKKSWHHTSSHYNRTNFYSIDEYNCINLTIDRVNELEQFEDFKPISEIEKWQVKYLIWAGTRRHPTPTEHIEMVNYDISKNYVITKNGKKMINANGFEFIQKEV